MKKRKGSGTIISEDESLKFQSFKKMNVRRSNRHSVFLMFKITKKVIEYDELRVKNISSPTKNIKQNDMLDNQTCFVTHKF